MDKYRREHERERSCEGMSAAAVRIRQALDDQRHGRELRIERAGRVTAKCGCRAVFVSRAAALLHDGSVVYDLALRRYHCCVADHRAEWQGSEVHSDVRNGVCDWSVWLVLPEAPQFSARLDFVTSSECDLPDAEDGIALADYFARFRLVVQDLLGPGLSFSAQDFEQRGPALEAVEVSHALRPQVYGLDAYGGLVGVAAPDPLAPGPVYGATQAMPSAALFSHRTIMAPRGVVELAAGHFDWRVVSSRVGPDDAPNFSARQESEGVREYHRARVDDYARRPEFIPELVIGHDEAWRQAYGAPDEGRGYWRQSRVDAVFFWTPYYREANTARPEATRAEMFARLYAMQWADAITGRLHFVTGRSRHASGRGNLRLTHSLADFVRDPRFTPEAQALRSLRTRGSFRDVCGRRGPTDYARPGMQAQLGAEDDTQTASRPTSRELGAAVRANAVERAQNVGRVASEHGVALGVEAGQLEARRSEPAQGRGEECP